MPETAPSAVWLDRDVVEVVGEEAASFLQGQLSQDLQAIDDGASAWSWVLTPQGKVEALARVTRLSPQRWLLDTDGGWGEALVTRLNRFKLRTKVTIELRDWKVLHLTGPTAATAEGPNSGAFRVDPTWPGVDGVDLIGASLTVPPDRQLMGAGDYEAYRISLGFPKMGAELDDRTIPGETGLVPMTVSFNKGCYTGQELVARIDSRGGNVPRRLARLAPAARVEPGSALSTADGQQVGVITSAAETQEGRWVALGYLKRGADTTATFEAGPEAVSVTVEGLVG